MTVALDAAVISFWSYRKGQPVYKILFNVCALPLTIWLASHLFFSLTVNSTGGSTRIRIASLSQSSPVRSANSWARCLSLRSFTSA